MSLVRAQLGEPQTRYKLIGVDDAEGPPVPIPNTEVKLCGAEDSALATRCKNREMPILVASFPISNEADFYSRLFLRMTHCRNKLVPLPSLYTTDIPYSNNRLFIIAISKN